MQQYSWRYKANELTKAFWDSLRLDVFLVFLASVSITCKSSAESRPSSLFVCGSLGSMYCTVVHGWARESVTSLCLRAKTLILFCSFFRYSHASWLSPWLQGLRWKSRQQWKQDRVRKSIWLLWSSPECLGGQEPPRLCLCRVRRSQRCNWCRAGAWWKVGGNLFKCFYACSIIQVRKVDSVHLDMAFSGEERCIHMNSLLKLKYCYWISTTLSSKFSTLLPFRRKESSSHAVTLLTKIMCYWSSHLLH